MATTPQPLLDALDMVTSRRKPTAKAVGIAEALHVGRVRQVFEDPNIVAIGISEKTTEKQATGTLSLCFYVARKIPKSKLRYNKFIPPVVAAPGGDAVFTDVKAIGTLRPEVKRKAKPIQSGFSVGHIDISAGTVGAIVKKGGKFFILSNSHVLALSGTAKKGDKILYPGPADNGLDPKHLVGKFTRAIKFKPGEDFLNRMDVALAEILKERVGDLDFTLHGVKGAPKVVAAKRGMTVVKRGRTTGDTQGVIEDVNFRLIIAYDEVGPVGFLDQVLCTRYTKPGDSGSLVVDKASGGIVGLHFAGADGGSVFSPMAGIVKAIGFTFVKG